VLQYGRIPGIPEVRIYERGFVVLYTHIVGNMTSPAYRRTGIVLPLGIFVESA
jgi:hypothetical protein